MIHRFNLLIRKNNSKNDILKSITGLNIHNAFEKIMRLNNLNPNDFEYCQLIGDRKSLWYSYFKQDAKDLKFDKPLKEFV